MACPFTATTMSPTRLQLGLLAPLLLLRQLARVAALALLADDPELEEACAEALDLLLDGRAHVEAGDDCAEPPRSRDRLEPGHSCADDEHLCGRDRARRGHQ